MRVHDEFTETRRQTSGRHFDAVLGDAPRRAKYSTEPAAPRPFFARSYVFGRQPPTLRCRKQLSGTVVERQLVGFGFVCRLDLASAPVTPCRFRMSDLNFCRPASPPVRPPASRAGTFVCCRTSSLRSLRCCSQSFLIASRTFNASHRFVILQRTRCLPLLLLLSIHCALVRALLLGPVGIHLPLLLQSSGVVVRLLCALRLQIDRRLLCSSLLRSSLPGTLRLQVGRRRVTRLCLLICDLCLEHHPLVLHHCGLARLPRVVHGLVVRLNLRKLLIPVLRRRARQYLITCFERRARLRSPPSRWCIRVARSLRPLAASASSCLVTIGGRVRLAATRLASSASGSIGARAKGTPPPRRPPPPPRPAAAAPAAPPATAPPAAGRGGGCAPAAPEPAARPAAPRKALGRRQEAVCELLRMHNGGCKRWSPLFVRPSRIRSYGRGSHTSHFLRTHRQNRRRVGGCRSFRLNKLAGSLC